jgi:hypothetical protein
MSAADDGIYDGLICATTATNAFYIMRKHCGKSDALRHTKSLLEIFDVAPVDGRVLLAAAESGVDDFEDAVLHESAVLSGAELIVTRDSKGFAKSRLPVMSPARFLSDVLGL